MTKWEHIFLIPFYLLVVSLVGMGLYTIGSLFLFGDWVERMSVVMSIYVTAVIIYIGIKNT